MDTEYKMVPVEPTDEMRDAGNEVIKDRGRLFAAYRAMLAAAPVPPQGDAQPVAELQVAFFEHGPMATLNWFTPSSFEPGATKLYTRPDAGEACDICKGTGVLPGLTVNVTKCSYCGNGWKEVAQAEAELRLIDQKERDTLRAQLAERDALLKRSREFVAFVHKCVRRNNEYAPLHRQEMDELNRDLSAYGEPIVLVCEQCRGEGRVGGPAPDEGGGKNCPVCEGTGVVEPALSASAEPGVKPDGCCCPPKGFTGLWGAGMCPVHQGLRRIKPGVKP